MSFPNRLHKLRRISGLTQEEAAKLCGFQPSAWSHYETGTREPTLSNLGKICIGMGLGEVDVGWLVIGSDAKTPVSTGANVTPSPDQETGE